MIFEESFRNVLDNLKEIAKTETVIGDSFQLGEYTCVPVIRISLGVGTGGGTGDSPKSGKGEGGGTGGGVQVSPIAFLVSRGDEIRMLNVGKSDGKGLSALLDKAPDIVDKVLSMKKGKGEKEAEPEE